MPLSAPIHCPRGHPPHRERRCPACAAAFKTAADSRRGSARARGYDSRWDKARKQYLVEHPLCVGHERQGRYELATVVDHIKPHHGDQGLFWSRANWQSLCKECHDRKTATEDGGFGRKVGGGSEFRAGEPGTVPTVPRATIRCLGFFGSGDSEGETP